MQFSVSRAQTGATFAMCALVLLAGCSLPTAPQSKTPEAKQSSIAIEFIPPASAQQMDDAGLLKTVTGYWDAHAARDWNRLFGYERAAVPLSLDFYVPYHAKAWDIQRVQVLGVKVENDEVRLRMAIDLKNPANAKLAVVHREDRWVLVDKEWHHWVTDPMLTNKN